MGYFSTTDFSLLDAPPKPKGGDGDFVRGVKQSWQELQGTAAGAVGLAGAGLGIDRMKDWGLEVAEEKFAKSAAMGKPYDSLENIESVGNAIDWAQRGLGYVGAQAVPAILSGGVGSILGKKLVQKGIEELLKKGLTEEAKKLAVKASIRGAAAGAGASSYAQEAGSIYPDLVKEGHDEPGRAAAFAAPAAALDVLPQLRAAKAILGPAERETLKGMRRVGMETAKQAGAEGLTEGAQTAIERAAAYKDLNSADAWWEYANAAALGALGGGVLGGGTELVLGKDPVDLTKPGGAPTTESSVPATKSAAELGISRKTPYDPLARELQTPAAPGKDAAPLIIPGGAPTDNEGSPTGGGDQRVAVPSLGISRSLRDQYGAALEKQSRGELLTAAEVALLKDPPPTPSIILPGQESPPPASVPQIILPGQESPPPASVPQIILDGRVARAPTPPPATRAAAAAPPTPTWKQSARRAFIGAKGRGKSIQTVMAADNPQAAAQLAREIAYESTSSAEVRALDAVHKMLTGITFDQYDAADMERARQLEVVPEIKTVVDEKAHEAATSPLNDTPQPTQAAAEAGKYKKGKIEIAGVNIDVENPAGSKRRGVGEDGKAWESTLATHYGYVPGTVAADSTKQQKQGVDVVVKPGTPPEWTGQVFVVNQNKPDGTFDEHKAVFGAASADEARELYLSNYPQGWERRIRSIVPMTPEQFMVWAKDTGPSGPKAGALKLNRDITQGVKLQDAATEWDEEYRTKPEEPRFEDLSATYKTRWAQAVEDGYASGELFDEIVRDTRAVKLADEIKTKATKSDADIDGRGRKKRKEKANAKAVRSDEGQVREGGAEGQQGVQRGADEGGKDLQRDEKTGGAEAEQQAGEVKPEDLGELGTRQYSIGKKGLPEGTVIRLNLPHVPGGYEVTAVVGKEVYVDEDGRETENDGAAHKMVSLSYVVGGQQIQTRMYPAELQKNTKEVVGQSGDSARLNSVQKPSDALKPKGTTAKAVGDIVKSLTGERTNWRVTTFKGLEEAEAFINGRDAKMSQGLRDHLGKNEKLKPGTQAWVEEGKAYFILSEIRLGEELAVFLHEVGKHLGMESLIKAEQLSDLASQIRKWAAKNDGSLESVTAQKALERLALAGNEVAIVQNQDGLWRVYDRDGELVNGIMEKTEAKALGLALQWGIDGKVSYNFLSDILEHQSELPAYFIEEAVKAGVNPTAMSYKTPMARFLRKLWAIYKAALRKLGISAEKLTAQDVVDLAHGAARGALAAKQESQRQYSVAPAMKEIAKAAQVDNLGRSRRGILGLQFLRDIKDEYAERLPSVKAFVDRTFEMAATANELLKKAGRTAKRWASLGKSEAESLANLQAVATVMGIHPDIPLDDKDHLTAGAQTISNKHLMQQDKTFADDVRAAHANLAAQWAALSPEAKGVYTSARDEMASNWTKREELLNKTIHRYFDPEIAKAKAAKNEALARSLEKERKDYLKEFGRLLSRVKGPYFPLSRFGDFYVVHKSQAYLEAEAKLKEANDKLRELYTKYDIPEEEAALINAMNVTLAEHNLQPIKHLSDAAKKEIREARKASSAARKVVYDMQGREEHYANEAFESESRARARAAELGVSVRLKEDYLREVSSTSYAMINKIGDAIEGSIGDKRVAMQAREAMMRIWLQSLPDTSALRHQLKRKNVAGFSKDMLRSFSQYSQRDAHYLSRLTHMDDIVDSLFQLRRDTRGKGIEGEELYNELARRYAASLKYVDTPVQDAISALAFVFQLGVSPAFLLTNLSQPFMISLPIMAAKHGLRRSTGAMASAWADVWKAATTSLRDQRTMAFEIATGNFTDGEQQMLQKTLKAGLLEITLEYDLGALAEGGETHVKKATRAMAIVPHQVEVVNRMATALAAYRMEVAKSGQEKATEHAMDVVSRTHYDYSAANAPYFLKPGVVPMSKLIFQYRKYQLGTLTLLARQIGAAFKGESPEVRAEAKRALFGLAAMHATFAGAMGLPFVGTLTFLANVVAAAFGDDDQPFDAEAAMRNWFADVLGKDAGAVAAKGIPMLFGADFSNKVGMGSIAAPIRVLRDNKEGRDLYLEALAATAGPAIGGLGPRIADGFKQMEDGNLLKAAEMFTPKFASDVIKAARLTTEGQVTKGGNVSIKPEEVSAWDAALAGLGISPASLTERSAATAAVFDAKEDLKKRRGELERKYVKARVDGDSEAMSEVRAQIDAFNAKRKERGEPTIKTADLLNAYKQRRNYDKNRTEEGVSLNRREKALGQYGRFADVK